MPIGQLLLLKIPSFILGLKADGKVGSKTWMELEKYLTTKQ